MHMSRVRWRAGSRLTAAELNAEQADLLRRQADVHQNRVHESPGDETAYVAGARIRAVDRSVELALPLADGRQPLRVPAKGVAAGYDRRAWAVSIGREILTLGWQVGAKVAGTLRGSLASGGLSCGSLRLKQPGPAPTEASPFRLLRVAADRKKKTPEMLMIELAAPADPEAGKSRPDPKPPVEGKPAETPVLPPPGLRIGAMMSGGFVRLFEVIPGRGVVIRGDFNNRPRIIVRKPPGNEPSDEQLVQAFLRTEAGQKERKRIEDEVKTIEPVITSGPTLTDAGEGQKKAAFGWTLDKKSADIKVTRLKAMAALAPVESVTVVGAPIWTELTHLPATTLEKGTPLSDSGSVVLAVPQVKTSASAAPTPHTGRLKMLLLFAAESDYGIAVTKFTEKEGAP